MQDKETSSKTAIPAHQDAERIAKRMARVGLCSRREAESWIEEGRVSVNGRILKSPAHNVGPKDKILVDGKPIPDAEPTRAWLYHKPRGLVTSHSDPEGRRTVFEALDEDMPRVISVGRLDINTEGLLILTNDGGLARILELPSTGWMRRYRVRAFGTLSEANIKAMEKGMVVDGVAYGPIEVKVDKGSGENIWLTLGLREGKNREIKKVLGAFDLKVSRLIRISYGPFMLGDLKEGEAREIRPKVLKDQLGERLIRDAHLHFPDTREAGLINSRPRKSAQSSSAEEKPRPNRGKQRASMAKSDGKPDARRAREATSDRPKFSTRDKPRQERGDKPRSDKPRSDRPRSDAPKSDRPRSDRPHSDRPRSDRPFSDRPRSDKPRSDKPRQERGDKPRSDKPRSDWSKSDKPRSDKPRSDKPRGYSPRGQKPRFGDGGKDGGRGPRPPSQGGREQRPGGNRRGGR